MYDDIPIEIKIYLDNKFKDKWPNVTKNEIRMCLLNELNIRGKDIKKITEKYLAYLSFLDFLRTNNLTEEEYLKNSNLETNFIKGE